MMQIGYMIYQEEGYALYACEDSGECLTKTMERVCQFAKATTETSKEFMWVMNHIEMAIQERDLTQEDADKLNAAVVGWLAGVAEEEQKKREAGDS